MSETTTRIVLNQSALDELFLSISGPVGKTLVKAAIEVENNAKRLCPVDTGRLRSSITHEIARLGSVIQARVGTNVEYAVYVEFGTRFMAAQPFLRPAIPGVKL